MSIASEITRLQGAKSDLATSIAAKGVTVPAATKIDGYADLVDQIQQGGSGPIFEKDVNFIDYDGSLLHSYTFEEIASLTSLPDNPSHEGLVAQGWNFSLAEVKSLTPYYVGQLYTTPDGWGEMTIRLVADMTFTLGITEADGKKVDWGDGSSMQTISGSNPTHMYASAGTYVIRIEGGSINYGSGVTPSKGSIVRFVAGNISLKSDAFRQCSFIKNIICSTSTTISVRCFYRCKSLECVVADKQVAGASEVYGGCLSLTKVSLTPRGNNWSYTLKGSSVQVIDARVSTDTSINNIESNTLIKKLFLNPSINYTSIDINLGVDEFIAPSNVSGFPRITLARKIVVNNATSISDRRYQSNDALQFINIPQGVTTIGLYAFYEAACLRDVVFEGTTPPAMPNADTFKNNHTDLRLRIPYASTAYLTATNYPSAITTYVGYGTFENGVSLPTTAGSYALTWYALVEDERRNTNPITTGNGGEVYCKYTAI